MEKNNDLSIFIDYLISKRGYDIDTIDTKNTTHINPDIKPDIVIHDENKNILSVIELKHFSKKNDAISIEKAFIDKSIIHDFQAFLILFQTDTKEFSYYKYNREAAFNPKTKEFNSTAKLLEKLDDFPRYNDLKKAKTTIYTNSENDYKNIAIPKKITFKKKSDLNPVLGVKYIAHILSSIIIELPNENGMMIGVFGRWGRGKTFFTDELWTSILNKKENYKKVIFSAWKYQDSKESWAYLYEVFINQYLSEIDKEDIWFNKLKLNASDRWLNTKWNLFISNTAIWWLTTKKIWSLNLEKHKWSPIILFALSVSIAIVWVFTDKISLLKILISSLGLYTLFQLIMLYITQKSSAIGLFKKYFSKIDTSKYLGLQSEIENELINLLKTWIPNPTPDNKIVLVVDDLDRCDTRQIINIIDGLRVILDNPELHSRLIIILNIDDEIIKKTFYNKYENLKLDTEERYKEYLEKVFIIGIKLNSLNESEIEEFTEEFLPRYETKKLKVLVEPAITMWNNNDNNDKMCLHETEAKYKTATQYIYLNNKREYDNIPNTNHDSREYITIEKNKKLEKILVREDSNVEMSKAEIQYFKEKIKELENATPRKIKIFYYQLILMKQLFYAKLNEKNLLDNWKSHCNETILIDAILKKKNGESIKYETSKDIENELNHITNMVVVL